MQANHNTYTVPFNFNGIPLNAIKHEEDLWLTGTDIGLALEHADPRDAINKLYKRNQKELDRYSIVIKLPVPYGDAGTHDDADDAEVGTCGDSLSSHVGDAGTGATRLQPVRVFNEEGVMILTMLSSQPRAADFRAWAVKILKAYRHGNLALSNPLAREQLLITCIKEARFDNAAALHTLIAHFGYPEDIRTPPLGRGAIGSAKRPAIVDFFVQNYLPSLAEDIRVGRGPLLDDIRRKRPAFLRWKIVHESGTLFALDHRAADLLEVVAGAAKREGIECEISGPIFGKWLNQIEAELNAIGWSRRWERVSQGAQVSRLMLLDGNGV